MQIDFEVSQIAGTKSGKGLQRVFAFEAIPLKSTLKSGISWHMNNSELTGESSTFLLWKEAMPPPSSPPPSLLLPPPPPPCYLLKSSSSSLHM